jgi:DnaJ-class molecular chaperone
MDSPEAADFLRNIIGGDVSDLFGRSARGGSSGGRARRGRRPPPEETETEVTLPFLTAARGDSIDLTINGQTGSVKVPAGVEDGQVLRVPAPGGGSVRLKLHIQPHSFFRREGKNIILTVPLSLAEAILGTKVDVPTLDGSRVSVKVPSGTSSGARLRLRGLGIAGGDQYIEIQVMVPTNIDDRSRQLLEEFNRLNPQKPRGGLAWS